MFVFLRVGKGGTLLPKRGLLLLSNYVLTSLRNSFLSLLRTRHEDRLVGMADGDVSVKRLSLVTPGQVKIPFF